MSKGKINVSVENIFPLIKKFLYSDHEIFLRELISNATDASLKLKHLSNLGEPTGEVGDLIIEIKLDKENKTLHNTDVLFNDRNEKPFISLVQKAIDEFKNTTLKKVVLSHALKIEVKKMTVVQETPRHIQ